MKPQMLHWDAYSDVRKMLETLEEYREVFQIIASNKWIGANLLQEVSSVGMNLLEPWLQKLRRHGLIIISDKPFVHRNSIILEEPCYRVNWKMIRAINKAISTL